MNKIAWNKGIISTKRKQFVLSNEAICERHGLHSGWYYNNEHNQLTCRLCMKDNRDKRNQKDNYLFKKFIIWTKARCKKSGKDFDLTEEFIANLYLKQDGKCALSSIVLNEDNLSLDRIDSSKGYTKDNIQWVDYDVNRMKTDLKQEEFIRLCNLIASK